MLNDESLSLWCHATFDIYLQQFPAEAPRLGSLHSLLAADVDLRSRATLPGHLTASGILADLSRKRILLIHHRGLDRWLQPGGHLEADELPPAAARREVMEEVGIVPGVLLSPVPGEAAPIDLDSHAIPASAKRNEPAHLHHDFRFVFAADERAQGLVLAEAEVAASAWVAFDDPRLEPSLLRVVHKLEIVPLHAIAP